MSKLLVCYYDNLGQCPVSYQIYNSVGDFFRSVVTTAHDKSLPFSQFSSDYSVHPICKIDGLSTDVLIGPYFFHFTFSQVLVASKGMDPKLNFNTDLFVERLKTVVEGDDDKAVSISDEQRVIERAVKALDAKRETDLPGAVDNLVTGYNKEPYEN